jgi:hypothetical protein
MDLFDLTSNQLQRAAAIKEQIEDLNNELRSILSGSSNTSRGSTKKPTMSASVKRKIAATQRARRAKIRSAKSGMRLGSAAAKAQKKTFSRATRAKLSRKLKAYWAAKRAGKK